MSGPHSAQNLGNDNPSIPTMAEAVLNPSPLQIQNVIGDVDPNNDAPMPAKRRPGRPKGSGKKYADVNVATAKLKRPVGRPRKDGFPAGSVTSRRSHSRNVTTAKSAPVHDVGLPHPEGYFPFAPGSHPQWPATSPPRFGSGYASASAPPMATVHTSSTGGTVPYQVPYAIDPNLDRDDWADLARTKINVFLATLLSSLHAPNPVSSAGPSVEEAFKSHLVSLAPNVSQIQPIPSLYSILKTFWLPSSPAYFSLTASASTARTPSEHRFLYWDPQPLVFNGIACPHCSTPLANKGRIRSGPIKIYDIEKPFFIIGCEYVCKSDQCISLTSAEGRKFASTDSSILRSLPVRLKDEFPARLVHSDIDAGSGSNIWNWQAMGVSLSLWNMVRGCLRSGLKKHDILQLIRAIQHGVDDMDKREEEEEADGEGEETEAEVAQGKQPDGQENGVQNSAADSGHGDNFTDAYNKAWKANAAVTDSNAETSEAGPSTTSASASVVLTPNGSSRPSSQPYGFPQGTPFAPYSFAAYSYFSTSTNPGQSTTSADDITVAAPGIDVNNDHNDTSINHATSDNNNTSNNVISPHPEQSQSHAQKSLKRPFGVTFPAEAGPSNLEATALESSQKRTRHCCKCGSQDCKGKGGRSFCMNACQDCGKLDCKGRNSRRPDKQCAEAWT